MVHAVRVATDADHIATVLSVDGMGFDHEIQSSVLRLGRFRRKGASNLA